MFAVHTYAQVTQPLHLREAFTVDDTVHPYNHSPNFPAETVSTHSNANAGDCGPSYGGA